MTSEDHNRRRVEDLSRDCRVVEGSGWGEVGGVLVPRVTTVVPEGAVRSHFNTDLNTGGVTPVF